MSDLRTAAQQALEALNWYAECAMVSDKAADAASALKAALAEEALQRLTDVHQEIEAVLEQEPVAWMVYTQDGKSVCVTDNPADFIEWRSFPLYTHPPRREWRGLTEEEFWPMLEAEGRADRKPVEIIAALARAIEAALKERNA